MVWFTMVKVKGGSSRVDSVMQRFCTRYNAAGMPAVASDVRHDHDANVCLTCVGVRTH